MTPAEALDIAWRDYENESRRCAKWLQAALDESPIRCFGLEHVWDELKSQNAVLWPLPDAACVTQVKQYPTGVKVMTIWLAGGNLGQLQDLDQRLETYAKGQGCQWTMIVGRDWRRTLNNYRKAGTVLVKDLSE